MNVVTRYRLPLLGLLLVLQASCAFQPYESTLLPLDPAVKVGKLDNGLTYYIRKNSKPENKAELRLVVNAGSIEEDDDQLGLAHFTEHMAFNGTRDFKKNELVSYLQSIGVEFGADLNAYTSYDQTVYMLSIPLQNPQNIETAFTVLENWAGYITFENEEIEKERGVVLEELRNGKGAIERMWKKFAPELLMDSKYAKRDPIGDETLLKTFSPDVIKRFYRDWYRPELMAVVAVGDFDSAAIEKMIIAHFSILKNPDKKRSIERPAIATRTDTKAMVLTDKEATATGVMIIYPAQKDIELKTISDYRKLAVEGLARSMLDDRLYELSVSQNPPFASPEMDDFDFVRDTVFPYMSADITHAGLDAAITASVREVNRVYLHGFTAGELGNAKKDFEKNIRSSLKEKDTTESASYASEYISHYLEQVASPGVENEYIYYMRYLQDITLQDVNSFIKNHIANPDHYLAVYMAPEKSSFPAPTDEQLLFYINKVDKSEITSYEYKKIPETLMADKPPAGTIVSENKIEETDFTELTLSNGIKVILKPTNFKNDEVLLSGFRQGGQYLYPDSDQYSARYAATLINVMGLGDFTPIEISKILSGKHANVNASFSTIAEDFDGYASKSDVEEMLQILYLYVTHPRKDQDLFNTWIDNAKQDADDAFSDPYTYFLDKKSTFLYSNDPRRPRRYTSSDFDKVDMDRAFDIFQERFGDVSGFTFIIVGAFDVEKIKPLIETYIASLPVTGKSNIVGDAGLRPVTGVIKNNVYKGQDAKSEIDITFTGEANYSRIDKLKMAALVDILNIKIIESLREELGTIYSGGVAGWLSKEPYQSYTLKLELPCGPENVDKAIGAFWTEVNKLKQNGPDPEDLHKFKEAILQRHIVSLQDNGSWSDRLEIVYQDNEDPVVLTKTKERILTLTQADVQEAAQRYLNEKNYLQTVLYPEKGDPEKIEN